MIEHPRTLNRPHLGRVVGGPLAAATDFLWTPDPRTHVEILSVHIILTTDANAANRRVRLTIGTLADDDVLIMSTGTQGATLTYDYWFLRGLGFTSGNPGPSGYNSSLPMGFVFQNPLSLRSTIDTFQVGDVIDHWAVHYMSWQDPAFAG